MADNRRMCPHCRAFITTSDRVCPYCNEVVGAKAIDVRQPAALLGGLIPASRFTTSVILLINIGFYIACYYGGVLGSAILQIGDKDRQAILEYHQYWRLITAGFLHGGFLHVAMNMWVLNDLGAEVERTYGTARFLVIYIATTICGYLLSTYWVSAPSLGASAGLLGLIGAMIAFGLRNRTAVGRQMRSFYVKWAVYGVGIGFLLPSIDNAAHIGGLASGVAIGYFAGDPVHSSRIAERFWQLMAILSVAATAYSFWILFQQLMDFKNQVTPT